MSLEIAKKNIAIKLIEKGITQEGMAKDIGLHSSVLSQKINGKGRYKLNLDNIYDILKYFDCKFEDIFGGNDE